LNEVPTGGLGRLGIAAAILHEARIAGESVIQSAGTGLLPAVAARSVNGKTPSDIGVACEH